MSKYNAKKTTMDGHVFDSMIEARQYLLYKSMLKSGEISSLALHPTFVLQEKFKRDGKTYAAIKYTADFLVEYPDGRRVAVEVKSAATRKARDYSLRKRLFLNLYRDIDFEEVLA